MGKPSRDKGKRLEYSLRDHLREAGYKADRVPMSGAAQGFKGDIKFSKDGKTYLAELKGRKDEYKRIYALFDNLADKGEITFTHRLATDRAPLLIHVADHVDKVLAGRSLVYQGHLQGDPTWGRTTKKVAGMLKLVKDCDILVLKCDYKPFLFVRYYE